MSEGYNGWTNYETWNVKLWIDNDQGEQEFWQERAEGCIANTDDDGDAIAALSNELEAAYDELYEQQSMPPGPLSDILRAALSEVNWHEIASHMVEDAKEVSDA